MSFLGVQFKLFLDVVDVGAAGIDGREVSAGTGVLFLQVVQ